MLRPREPRHAELDASEPNEISSFVHFSFTARSDCHTFFFLTCAMRLCEAVAKDANEWNEDMKKRQSAVREELASVLS